jgi:hypothetical protein
VLLCCGLHAKELLLLYIDTKLAFLPLSELFWSCEIPVNHVHVLQIRVENVVFVFAVLFYYSCHLVIFAQSQTSDSLEINGMLW